MVTQIKLMTSPATMAKITVSCCFSSEKHNKQLVNLENHQNNHGS